MKTINGIFRTEKITAVLMVMMVGLVSVASTIKADFSGEWTFDPLKSNMSESSMMAPIKMIITQEKNSIVIQRVSRNQQNENMSMTDNISFDGKETDGTGFANSTRRSSMVWESNNSFKLKISVSGTMEGTPFNVSITEDWSLSSDRNTLTIDREANGTRGLVITKHVYNREIISSKK
ncbi:MAG TPA: hypothetical protein VFE57_05300 [Cyclobacteriaceae bacterium]|jgi:hypothetical protein|nr:hypothetical protein [Cyclobacteriaceae bacterium]